MRKKENMFLASQGIKYKLKIAFYLMSILPWLVCIYLVSNYIFPKAGFKLEILLFIVISFIIAFIGFWVIKEVFDRFLSVHKGVKQLANGDLAQFMEAAAHGDEVGELGKALNQFTQRIRSNMDELKSYSEKTTEINLEINKRIFILSNLLQISSMVSKGGKLDEILKLAIGKSRLLASSEAAYLFLRDEERDFFYIKSIDGMDLDNFAQLTVGSRDRVFGKVIQENEPLMIDKENELPEDLKRDFSAKFKLNNTLAVPVSIRDRVVGILGIGNTGVTKYSQDDIELLGLFAKQLAIALENDLLNTRLQKLEIKDELTGLYNEVYIHNRLNEEIKRAIVYQRPCAFVLLSVDNFSEYSKAFGLTDEEESLKKIATLIKGSTSEVDRVARTGNHEFAVILPERNKRQAQTLAENIRKKVENNFNKEEDPNRRLTVSGSVSENPLDGVEADELIVKAKELLKFAVSEGTNQIIIALKRK